MYLKGEKVWDRPWGRQVVCSKNNEREVIVVWYRVQT
jgi:hypothetical protein